ncbi:MAG TPA: radical SAM protein [Polyangiaceae bacterium]|jgi:radical SAM protein with 4Fe4S-binding SPASM domain
MMDGGAAFDRVLVRSRATHIPLAVSCEITHACNVDCQHCYLDLVPDSKIGALSTEEWKRIFRELRAAGSLFLTLTGGEVLVRKDWYELASYARELNFAVRIFTNGTLIDERNADRIASIHPICVEISLLGGIAATHDAISQRRGSFDKTLAGVRRLRARNIPVLLKCVLMKSNISEMEMLRAIAAEVGSHVQFDLEITPKNNGSVSPQALRGDEQALLAAAADLERVMAAGEEGSKSSGSRRDWLDEGPCAAGRGTCHISPTGDISPCTQWAGRPVGSLRKSSFAELWGTNEVFAVVRTKRLRDFPVCASCEILDACAPCMALSVLERGVIDGPSPTKCATAELRAKAQGMKGRSAWLMEQERALPPGAPDGTRRRLPLL